MASDISHPEKSLPLSWKSRLRDQPVVADEPRESRRRSTEDDRVSPATVVMEPTRPVTDLGLPAFKIRQEIAPQPFTDSAAALPEPQGLRTGVVIALGVAAIGVLVALGFVILS